MFERFHHDHGGEHAAHADVVVGDGFQEVRGIKLLHRAQGDFVEAAVFAVGGKMVHVAGDDQQRRLRQAANDAGQSRGELPAAIEVAAADRDADDARLRSEPREERQFHFDRVFLLVRGGVELQAGDRFDQTPRERRIGRDRRAGN